MNLQTNKGERKIINIKNLFLDPNNYRFIDSKDYLRVPTEQIMDKNIQKRTRNFIVQFKRAGIKDLIDSFKANGYLEVDQIQVEKISGTDNYKVIEGNRRVATLKELQEANNEGKNIGNLGEDIFSQLPVVDYPITENGYLEIVMGLKHINGNKKWETLNQSELLNNLIHKYKWKDTRVCKSLGISKHKLRRSLRTISIIEHFKKSDWGDKFYTNMYAIFEEIVSSVPIKNWIAWDDAIKKPQNEENIERLYRWLVDIDDDKDKDDDAKDKDGIIEKKEKIVNISKDIREIAKFINDENALSKMEETRSIIDAYSVSELIGTDIFNNSLNIAERKIKDAYNFLDYADNNSKNRIKKLINTLEGLAVSKGFKEIVFTKNKNREAYIGFKNSGFASINIKQFKQFNNLKIDNINRINIFAGSNNSGKSSIIELIYLLTKQNDLNAFFEIQRRRGKFHDKLPVKYVKDEFKNSYEVAGNFDNKEFTYQVIHTEEENTEINMTYHDITVEINSSFARENLYSRARIIKDETELESKKIRWICNAMLSSPFSSQNTDDLIYCHEKSNELNIYEDIIKFLQKYVDNGIEKITYVGEGDTKRFLVKHKKFKKAVDLTRFGDGVQRIFYISLQIAASINGVMCVDEIDNAIHYNLFVDFVTFLQELASKFNVQLFITSHNAELLDAFLNENIDASLISWYRLEKNENKVSMKNVSGEKYKRLRKNFNQDIRGAKK